SLRGGRKRLGASPSRAKRARGKAPALGSPGLGCSTSEAQSRPRETEQRGLRRRSARHPEIGKYRQSSSASSGRFTKRGGRSAGSAGSAGSRYRPCVRRRASLGPAERGTDERAPFARPDERLGTQANAGTQRRIG